MNKSLEDLKEEKKGKDKKAEGIKTEPQKEEIKDKKDDKKP